GLLLAALPEPGKISIGAVDVRRDSGAVAPRHGPDLEVFPDGLANERAAALRHMRNAEAHDVLDCPAGQRLAAETNVSGDVHHSGYGPERRRLAGAVGAQQRGNAPFGDLEVKPEQHLGGAVEGAKPGSLQQHRGHHVVVPRYAMMTSGLV